MADLYLCNGWMERVAIVDDYISLVWAERYYAHGDYQLKFSKNAKSLSEIRVNRYFEYEPSFAHMMVETIIEDADEGTVIVSGRCLKALFMRRINKAALKKNQNGLAGAAAAHMNASVDENIINTTPTEDRITNLIKGPDYLPVGGGPQALRDFSAVSVYDELYSIASDVNVGWHMLWYDTFDNQGTTVNKTFVYHTYMGSDMTVKQAERDAVIFDPTLDNIEKVSQILSVQDWANVVAVRDSSHSDGYQYMPQTLPYGNPPYNVNRRVIVTSMGGEDRTAYTDSQWWELKKTYGRAALAKQTPKRYLDGRLLASGPYAYNWHYRMGDVVTIGQDPAFASSARVIEYIWSEDSNGVSEYPTFKLEYNDANEVF